MLQHGALGVVGLAGSDSSPGDGKGLKIRHSYTRPGGERPKGVGHTQPCTFLPLCREIEEHWDEIQGHIAFPGSLSISRPTIQTPTPRGVGPLVSLASLPEYRSRYRFFGRFLLQADIAEFYRSVYTHSIPWALHGKDVAKKERGNTLLGNRLDVLVRNCQDGQTNGIPIGPDTSLIVAEIILASVDKTVLPKLAARRGFRYYDDYELTFRRDSDAQAAQGVIQGVLGDYGLSLNPTKSGCTELPELMEAAWTVDLRTFPLEGSDPIHRVYAFFDKLFALKKAHRDAHVIAYGMRRVERADWTSDEWPLVQRLLMQALVIEPTSTQQFVVTLVALAGRYDLERNELAEVLNDMIVEYSEEENTNELAWALWASITFSITVSERAVRALSRVKDSFVALLALDAAAQGLVAAPLDITEWQQQATEVGALYGPNWLLAYEARRHGWLGFPMTSLETHSSTCSGIMTSASMFRSKGPQTCLSPSWKASTLRRTVTTM